MKRVAIVAFLLAITSLLACSSRTTLDRSKVLSLLGDKKEEVKSSIKSAPMMLYVDNYLKLAQAGIISCERGGLCLQSGTEWKRIVTGYQYGFGHFYRGIFDAEGSHRHHQEH